MNKIIQFLVSEEAATAVEYAVMLAFVAAVIVGAVTSLGTVTDSTFSTAATWF